MMASGSRSALRRPALGGPLAEQRGLRDHRDPASREDEAVFCRGSGDGEGRRVLQEPLPSGQRFRPKPGGLEALEQPFPAAGGFGE
ncbi:MAG: hypothetical protein U5L11_06510 [Arhodomonas sp.]|nr:hypothetical protein [Arhodomonas sp.]